MASARILAREYVLFVTVAKPQDILLSMLSLSSM